MNDFSCIIHKGTFVGINGDSGKGKTTLIDMLLGFLSPQSGNIFFNDEKVYATEIKNFRQQIAYVKQKAFLLCDSIFNNITLYEKEFDEKKLNHILNVAGLKIG